MVFSRQPSSHVSDRGARESIAITLALTVLHRGCQETLNMAASWAVRLSEGAMHWADILDHVAAFRIYWADVPGYIAALLSIAARELGRRSRG